MTASEGQPVGLVVTEITAVIFGTPESGRLTCTRGYDTLLQHTANISTLVLSARSTKAIFVCIHLRLSAIPSRSITHHYAAPGSLTWLTHAGRWMDRNL